MKPAILRASFVCSLVCSLVAIAPIVGARLLVEKLAPDTRFPSLLLNVGGADSLSWTASGVNLPAESSPSKLFQQLFVTGTPSEVKQQLRELRRGRSILDTIDGGKGLENARFANLFVEIGRHLGAEIDAFGTSNAASVKGWNA